MLRHLFFCFALWLCATAPSLFPLSDVPGIIQWLLTSPGEGPEVVCEEKEVMKRDTPTVEINNEYQLFRVSTENHVIG